MKRDEDHWLKEAWRFNVQGSIPQGRPKKTWQGTISEDLRQLNITKVDVGNQSEWNRASKRNKHPTPQCGGQRDVK